MRTGCVLILLVLTACGDDGPRLSVRVVDRSDAPSADVTVLFQDADGRIVGQATTDADGHASGPAADDGMVTVVWLEQRSAHTVVGVEPGDELLVRAWGGLPEPPTRTLLVDLPMTLPMSFDHTIHLGCARGGITGNDPPDPPPIAVTFRGDCPDRGPVVVQTTTVDEVDAFSLLEDTSLAEGATLAMPEFRTDLDVSMLAVTGGVEGEYTVTSRTFDRGGLFAAFGELVADGQAPLRFLPGFGTAFEVDLHWVNPAYTELSQLRRRSPERPGDVTVDHGELLPAPAATELDGDTLIWAFDGSSDEIDGQYVSIIFRDEPDGALSDWSFILPPDRRAIRFPELPSGVDIVQQDWPPYSRLSGALDISWLDWDDYRLGRRGADQISWSEPGPDVPDDGVVRASQSQR